MCRDISRETKRIAEEDLAVVREDEEDEREQKKRVENKKKETRTKGGGGTQIAGAKKAHAFSLRGSFNSFSPRFVSSLGISRRNYCPYANILRNLAIRLKARSRRLLRGRPGFADGRI